MKAVRVLAVTFVVLVAQSALAGAAFAQTEAGAKPFEPRSGQPGKDVVWVPTPDALVEKMLDLAQVTKNDVVMDLGSGDGRNIIAAAKRGARAVGVEFNPDMVALSRRKAEEAGVSGLATFVEGDMYTADVSKATVLALFLLPSNLDRLKDTFLALPPGTRIVLNTFSVNGWDADRTDKLETDCDSWCTAMLVIVPASVVGPWRIGKDTLLLDQQFQKVTGTLASNGKDLTVTEGRLAGRDIVFSVDGSRYAGRVDGDRMTGTVTDAEGKTRKFEAARRR